MIRGLLTIVAGVHAGLGLVFVGFQRSFIHMPPPLSAGGGATMLEPSPSVVSGQRETILVDVSLREPLLRTPAAFPVRTALRDPVGGRPIVPAVTEMARRVA